MTLRAARLKPPPVAWAVAVALSLGGCSSPPRQVVLGIALGRSNHPGVELAVEEINRAGGIGGATLSVVGLDWTDPGFADPDGTIQWADRLSSDAEVLAVIGHGDSTSTLMAAGLYNARGIPHIVTIATHPDISAVGPWTFRLCLDDASQGRLLAEHAVGDMGGRRIAVFYVNDDYGRTLTEHFTRRVRELQATIVSTVFHDNRLGPADDEVLEATIELLRNDEPDLLAFLNRPDAADAILNRLRAAGIDAPVLGADNVALLLSWDHLDRQLWNGARISMFYLPDAADERALRFVDSVRARIGRQPSYDLAFSYDAVHLLRDAIEQGGFSRADVRGHLERLIRERRQIRGVTGLYRLGPDRNARREMHVVELRDGEVVEVAKLAPATE